MRNPCTSKTSTTTASIEEEKRQYRVYVSSAFFDVSGQTSSCSQCRGSSTTSSTHITLISKRTCSMWCSKTGQSDLEMRHQHECWPKKSKRNSKEVWRRRQMPSLGFRRGRIPRKRMEVKAKPTQQLRVRWRGCRAACLASTQAHNSKLLHHQRRQLAKSTLRISQKQKGTMMSRNESFKNQAGQMDSAIYRSSFRQHMLILSTARQSSCF